MKTSKTFRPFASKRPNAELATLVVQLAEVVGDVEKDNARLWSIAIEAANLMQRIIEGEVIDEASMAVIRASLPIQREHLERSRLLRQRRHDVITRAVEPYRATVPGLATVIH